MARFISLFSGAGGLDLGLERSGWHCLYATDIDPWAVATLQANAGKKVGSHRVFSDTVVEQGDIREITGRKILRFAGVRRGDVDLLAGGPPCQSWSSAGHQRGLDDPRGRLFEDYVRVASQLDVRWLVFENVRGLVTAKGPDGTPGGALALIRANLLQAGWQTRVDLLNAADFGVPQRRVRLILLGYRVGDPPPLPMPTHSAKSDLLLKPWMTLGTAVASVKKLKADEIVRPSGKLAVELASVPPGSGVKSPGKTEATRPGGHWGYKQGAFVADLSVAARTVTASSQQDWIIDPRLGLRRLSPRECAAIQSFPSNWVFEGARAKQYQLIGNAVPPKLAQAIGRALLDHVGARGSEGVSAKQAEVLLPLPARIQGAIAYTVRDQSRNDASRRAAPNRRYVKRVATS